MQWSSGSSKPPHFAPPSGPPTQYPPTSDSRPGFAPPSAYPTQQGQPQQIDHQTSASSLSGPFTGFAPPSGPPVQFQNTYDNNPQYQPIPYSQPDYGPPSAYFIPQGQSQQPSYPVTQQSTPNNHAKLKTIVGAITAFGINVAERTATDEDVQQFHWQQ